MLQYRCLGRSSQSRALDEELEMEEMRIVKRPGTCESMKVIALCEMGRWSFSMFLRFNFWVSVSHVLSLGFACVFNTIMEPSCWEGERWWILLREKVCKFRDMPHVGVWLGAER